MGRCDVTTGRKEARNMFTNSDPPLPPPQGNHAVNAIASCRRWFPKTLNRLHQKLHDLCNDTCSYSERPIPKSEDTSEARNACKVYRFKVKVSLGLI